MLMPALVLMLFVLVGYALYAGDAARAFDFMFAADFTAREFVGSGRDRCDHTIERVRTIRTDRYRYTRNYLLDRVVLQPQYRDGKDYVKFLRAAYADGTLAPRLAEIYFGERPAEELYDLQRDPHELDNLADDDPSQGLLAHMKTKLLERLNENTQAQPFKDRGQYRPLA